MKLFIVSTSSQAFFLSKTSNIVNENAILLITKNKDGLDKKIISHLKIFPWAKILVWDIMAIENPAAYYKIFLFRIKIYLLKKKYDKINELYIGSYDNFFHLGLAAAFEDKVRLYLLYDGLQMVSVAQKRAGNRKESIRTYPKLFNFAGFKPPSLKTITYTSPLEFKVPAVDKIIKIKSTSNKSVVLKDELIYFVGQPLVDMGLVSFEFYLDKLNRLKTNFPEHHIIYIPHPKESPAIKKKISQIFEIKYFEKIFEQEYLEAKIFARNIVSFYSSVLMNIYYMANGDLNVYSIALNKSEILRSESIMSISKIYEYFESNKAANFNVIRF